MDSRNTAVAQNFSALRVRYGLLNRYDAANTRYDAAWTDSWQHRRCLHAHEDLLEAAKCAMPHGCGWYIVAIEGDKPRELTKEEDWFVNEFRFKSKNF